MHDARPSFDRRRILAEDSRFEVRLATRQAEVEAALRLRFEVFGLELLSDVGGSSGLDLDAHDRTCDHLILVEKRSGRTVGTYRMKSIEQAGSVAGFYSNDEFTLESLPDEIASHGIEIGRACIAAEHRNTRAIFLIWKALAQHLMASGKRYFFGCCSIFTDDPAEGPLAFRYLERQGLVHDELRIQPRRPIESAPAIQDSTEKLKLPGLFEMYLRIGSRVCGPPIWDAAFGTVDFFVVFDLETMNPKYRQMFIGEPA